MFISPSSRAAFSTGLAFALVLLFSCAPALAQSNGDGSIYSRFGLGTLSDFSSSQSSALGDGGIALRSLNYNPTANPALWSDQVFTRLTAGASFQRISATSSGEPSSLLTAGSIEGVQFSFPLYERKLGVGISFQPYSQHNYRLQSTDSLQIGSDPTTTLGYTKNFRGTGGLHTIRGGLGYRINDALSVGASADVLFGIIENERTTNVDRTAVRTVSVSDATRLVGVTSTLGAQLTLADVLKEDDALSLGTAVALPTTLTGTRTLTRGEGRDLTPDTLSSVDGDASLPWRGRAGLAYQPNERWTFTTDGLYEPWSTFSSTFENASPFRRGFPEGGDQTMTDRWRLSVGTEVVPAGEGDALSGFFANTAYRLGVYTERLYVRPDSRTNVHTHAVTGGMSFPTSLSGTRIDLTLRAGTRGTTENTLVRDNFFGVALHINFGERWFQERKLR